MKIHLKKLNQRGFDHVFLAVAFIVVIGVIGTYTLLISHGEAGKTLIEAYSNNSGTCLTADGASSGDNVIVQKCSKYADNYQDWTLTAEGTYSGTTSNGQKITVSLDQLKASVGSNLCVDNWQDKFVKGTSSNSVKLYSCATAGDAGSWAWGEKDPGQQAYSHQLGNLGSWIGGGKNSAAGYVDCLDILGGTGPSTDSYLCKETSSQGFANQEWFLDTAPTGTAPTPIPVPAPVPGPVSPITYNNYQGTLQAYSSGSGHCVTANATVELSGCTSGNKAQSWKFNSSGSYTVGSTVHAAYYITSTNNSSECLTIVGSAIDLEGTCGIQPTQRWYWGGVSNHQLINPATNKCLDDYQGSLTGKLDLYACKSSTQNPSNQEWFE